MSGYETLRDFKEPFMEIMCRNCSRKGRYKVSPLIEKWGPDLMISSFIANLGFTCPRYVKKNRFEPCGIGCQQLTHMFSPAPFTEEFRRKQISSEAPPADGASPTELE